MRRRSLVVPILAVSLACAEPDTSDGAEGESSGTATSMTSDTDTATDTGETDTGEPDPCEAMDATVAACGNPSLHAYVWDGQTCVYIEGCECTGTDCDGLFTYEPTSFTDVKNGAEHACWTAYIDAGCMTDPCDCPGGEYCVAFYDGVCTGGNLLCTPMPMGCEDDPEDCASGCPEAICGFGNQCNVANCGNEWPNAVYCYGV